MKTQTLKFKYAGMFLLAMAMLMAGCAKDSDVINPEPDPVPGETPEPDPVVTVTKMVLEEMTLEEKVAQMFIVDPERLSTVSPCTFINPSIAANLDNCPVGGIIFFGQNIEYPHQIKRFISDLQKKCKYPLFFAIDEEGGAVARIANNSNFDVEKFSSMLDIGNTGNTDNAYHVGCTIGAYLAEYGFNLDFAPVADVFSNPANTVIGKRSFGTTADVVSPMVGACVDGLHSKGIYATLKHFPGHGDTDTDSHTSLPLVTKTWEQLLESEIIPFKDNFDKADMIMTAHIAVKDVNEAVDGNTVPSTLSYNMITGKLRGELGYQGIIITDALRMAAIANFYPTQGEAAVQAIKAGVDMILCPGNFLEEDGTYQTVLNAVKSGEIPLSRIDESVSRIIALKNKL